ncbi:M17 family metallopeptidase [uncultured Microscilla sp.]|uniref:leucyl aminopeptidase family protein n=1 Tax=uncultured Microscilla sp. TaxID=432653 RepID=UPI00260CFA31|nr:leucyl aminopeptidase family protein [uncultured Microscilla sp.]
MQVNLLYRSDINASQNLVVIVQDLQQAQSYCASEQVWQYLQKQVKDENKEKVKLIHLNQFTHHTFVLYSPPQNKAAYYLKESYRKKGHEIASILAREDLSDLQITNAITSDLVYEAVLDVAEGILLSTYHFLKYKSDPRKLHPLVQLTLSGQGLTEDKITTLNNIVQGTFAARNLVNEPFVYLTAPQLSEEIKKLGKEAGFEVEVFDKAQIQAHNMEGLLTVNKGSLDPPTFNILTHKPANAVNEQPYILVGKGVVYDTGGLSLKPTGNSMDFMKSDMGGAAAVVGSLYALAKNNAPVYVIGLIPATDNRPGQNAIAPGDVITYSNGKSVEIMNTDAEGRLILADALIYAARFKPQLVLDFATLTGSAVRALGNHAMVMVGTAERDIKSQLLNSSEQTYERMVELPLWEEYGEPLESDIADINNLGISEAQAIIAGKFLEHFVDNYPWIHLDIAGTAYLHKPQTYKGKNGTGSGVRLMYHFLTNLVN